MFLRRENQQHKNLGNKNKIANHKHSSHTTQEKALGEKEKK
jgi:hypothetical protein